MTSEIQSTELEALYKAAIGTDKVNRHALVIAERVVDRLLKAPEKSGANDLTGRIATAAGKNDIDAIFKLVEELKQSKADEESRQDRLNQVTQEFEFPELLQAFNVDYRDLVYEIGLLILQNKGPTTPRQRKGKSTVGKRGKPSYRITRGDNSILVKPQPGAPRTPGVERDFYEFMGFRVADDGRGLHPETFRNYLGDEVVVSKRAIIDDLIRRNERWTNKGYSITEIPVAEPTK